MKIKQFAAIILFLLFASTFSGYALPGKAPTTEKKATTLTKAENIATTPIIEIRHSDIDIGVIYEFQSFAFSPIESANYRFAIFRKADNNSRFNRRNKATFHKKINYNLNKQADIYNQAKRC